MPGTLSVDFHNHVIPAVDDGARDGEQARDAVRALYDEGVRDLIAGVHLDASMAVRPYGWADGLDEIDERFEELRAIVREHVPELRLHRGAEIKLDTPDADLADHRLRLAATRFTLVEFAALEAPPYGARLIENLRAATWVPVLAHPERYRGARDLVAAATEWVHAGAFLQLNCGSLTGRYGRSVQDAARALIEAGLISYLSSDFHASGRTWIPETLDEIQNAPGGREVLEILDLNGRRLLADEEPLPVPPVRVRQGLLHRLRAAFRT